MRYNQTPIFQHVYRLTIEMYKCAENFKKSYKYTLGEKLKTLCHDMIDLIIIANSLENKIETINKLGLKLETFRIYLRLAFDLKIISHGLMESMNKRIEEIGKQIGGWRNWALKNTSASASAGVSRVYGPGKRA